MYIIVILLKGVNKGESRYNLGRLEQLNYNRGYALMVK